MVDNEDTVSDDGRGLSSRRMLIFPVDEHAIVGDAMARGSAAYSLVSSFILMKLSSKVSTQHGLFWC
jgi:hypothetical protein